MKPEQWANNEVTRKPCPACEERRIPQYDVELDCAHTAVREWMTIARRLHNALGHRKNDRVRTAAQYQYLDAVARYAPTRKGNDQ
jgi:hypothetical protein